MTITPAMQSVASIITQTRASNPQPSTRFGVCCVRAAAAQPPSAGLVVEVAR